MRVIKPQRLGVQSRTYEFEGKFYLAVSTMAYFAFDMPGRLLSEVSMWKFLATALGKDAVLDMGMPKKQGEFLVYGQCHAPAAGPVTALPVRVRVGAQAKNLHVFGNRQWNKRGPVFSISEPEPFTRIRIDYANAFGGPDYPQNPTGKGMPPADASAPWLLPNIELPGKPITFTDDRPAPAGLGPLDFTWPQRFSKAGTHDQKWLETRFPGFAADMDWTLFNAAPEDQWLSGFFAGEEAFEVSGMHAEKSTVSGRLPGCASRCFITRKMPGGDAFQEVPTRAETLFLFPGAERGIVLFRGVVEIGTDDGADVLHLLVGADSLASPKPEQHYKDILAIRLDRKLGAMHALNDAPLLPDMPQRPSGPDAEDDDGMEAMIRPNQLHRKNLLRKQEKVLAESKEKLSKMKEELLEVHRTHGLPPLDTSDIDRAMAVTIEPDPAPPALEELPKFKADMDALLKKGLEEGQRNKAEALERIRAACVEQKLDFDQVMADAKREGRGPPKPLAPQVLQAVQGSRSELQSIGQPNADLERLATDPALSSKLAQADAMRMDSYRKHGHLQGAAAAMPAQANQAARTELSAMPASGRQFAGRDFTGADLSGLDLSGADFSNALMECANLSGTNLQDARFSGAVLARAVFTGAMLAGASFKKANMGFAVLSGAAAAGVDLAQAVLAGADLTGIDLSGANLAGCDFMGARFAGANLSGVKAHGAKFIEVDLQSQELPTGDMPPEQPPVDLRGVRFAGADFSKALFMNCQIDNADFSGANLSQAIFLSASGSGVNFSGADLSKLCVVKDSRLDKANFRGAKLHKANMRGTDLAESVFAGADLSDGDFSEASMPRVDLRKAKAVNVRMVRTDLKQADLSGADFRQAVLQKADLRTANFQGCNLFGADLLRAIRDTSTILDQANLKKAVLLGAQTS